MRRLRWPIKFNEYHKYLYSAPKKVQKFVWQLRGDFPRNKNPRLQGAVFRLGFKPVYWQGQSWPSLIAQLPSTLLLTRERVLVLLQASTVRRLVLELLVADVFPDVRPELREDRLPPAFGREHDVVLAVPLRVRKAGDLVVLPWHNIDVVLSSDRWQLDVAMIPR